MRNDNPCLITSSQKGERKNPQLSGVTNISMATFQYVQPTEEQKALMQQWRDKYEVLALELKTLPASRGLSLALTKLEESSFWLNKAITQND